MEKLKCKKCPKTIEGYSESHVKSLMRQHEIRHLNEEEREAKKK